MDKILFLKKLDSFIGPLLVRFLSIFSSKKNCYSLTAFSNVLIIRPGGIGDAVLLLPTLQLFKKSFPDSTVYLLAEKRNAQVFDLCEGLSAVWAYDCCADWKKFFFKKFDLIIDTEQSHFLSAVIARVLRAELRCGFATNRRGDLFDRVASYDQNAYEVESFFHLVNTVKNITPAHFNPPFIRPESLMDIPFGGLDRIMPKNPYVVVFPGASVADKRWPVERFMELSERLNDTGYEIVIVGAGSDFDLSEQIAGCCGGVNIAGKTSLPQVARIISGAELFIGGDSGLMHLAVAVGGKTVSLFGPSNPAKWGPRGDKHRVISLDLPCSPCSRFGTIPECHYDYRCIKEIAVSDVLRAVEGFLN